MLFVCMAGGCRQPEAAKPEQTVVVPETVSVVFVDSSDVADNVARQWTAQTGGRIETRLTSTQEFLKQDALAGGEDVIIYPGHLVGQLVDKQMIYPLTEEFWNSDDVESRSLLRHGRTTLIRFGSRRWAMSLGNPQWMLLIRNDVLDALQTTAPESWQQLVELAEQLAKAGELTDPEGRVLPNGVALPVSRDWAARLFLAISAASIRQPGKLDTLFDRRNMKPMIDQQPFQRALQLLERLASNSKRMSPADVTRSFFAGQLAVAICWPSRAFLDDELVDDDNAETLMAIQGNVLVTRLPGVAETYDLENRQWQPTGAGISRVELVGFDCRLASVLKSTKHPTNAFRFLAWLSNKQTVASVFSAASFGSPTRAGHLGDPLLWTGDVLDQTTADQYADLLQRINEEPVFLMFPRIEASERYWSTLEDAVQKFLAGEIDAAGALQSAAADWERITDECGRDRQIELLRKDQTF